MARKRHTPEQIINKLRQAEVEIANGSCEALHRFAIWGEQLRLDRTAPGIRIDQHPDPRVAPGPGQQPPLSVPRIQRDPVVLGHSRQHQGAGVALRHRVLPLVPPAV